MTTLDLRKQWKRLYSPSAKKVELVDLPEFKFVMIDGRFEPGQAPGTSPGFEQAMGALNHFVRSRGAGTERAGGADGARYAGSPAGRAVLCLTPAWNLISCTIVPVIGRKDLAPGGLGARASLTLLFPK